MNLKEKLTYIILKLLKKFFSLLNTRLRFWISNFIAIIIYFLFPIRKKVALKNLNIAFPKWSEKKRKGTIFKCYKFFIHNLIEFLTFPYSWQNIEIVVNGESTVKESLKLNKGVIFVTGHLGSWEIMGSWIGRNFPKFTGVAIKQKNLGAHQFFIEQRELAGTKHIFKKESIKKMYKVLSSNGILGLVSDQDAKKNGIFVDFFNKPASTPKGAALFNKNTNAPIIISICNQIHYNKYYITFYPLKEDYKTIKSITQGYTSILQNNIEKFPEQYFWFHKRWKTKQ